MLHVLQILQLVLFKHAVANMMFDFALLNMSAQLNIPFALFLSSRIYIDRTPKSLLSACVCTRACSSICIYMYILFLCVCVRVCARDFLAYTCFVLLVEDEKCACISP